MDGLRFAPSRTLEKEASRVIFARQASCTTCPDSAPTCPTCPSGQSCQVTVPLTCTECPKAYCAKDVTSPSTSTKSSSSSNTGAIAGGVIGGIALIGIVTYLIWRFCIKTKRQQISKMEEDGEYSQHQMDASQSFATRRDQRASTHTVHSIASTVLTRASNIIQIAYIPGVTNRAPPTSPTVLVPPVPPIPIAISQSQAGTPASTEDQHFFVPGDLRDSTYSGYSAFTDRTSYARTSYAPRSSIASTIYGKNAVIVPPPQTGMRIKPTMVNLKSPSNLGPGVYTPPVPSVDYEKYNNLRPVSSANSTFSVGSTFLNNASAAMPARPVVVRVGTGSKKSTTSSVTADDSGAEDGGSKLKADTFSEKADAKPSSPLAKSGHESSTYTIIEDSPSPDQGPFSDPPETPSSGKTLTLGSEASQPASPSSSASKRNTSNLSAVIEEATRRASQRDMGGSSAGRGRSPFGDENATQDI